MKIIIIAGGLGTRIAEETEDKPKPMVLINNKPIIWHLMNIFSVQGLNKFIISTGYKIRWDNGYYVFYPTLSLRNVVGAPLNISADANFLLNQLIWLGAGYRTDNTIVATAGVFLDLGWRFVYTYNNAALTKHSNTGSSHEFSVGYARTIPENPFTYRKFTKTNGDTKKKKTFNIKLPKIKIFKKLKGKMKYS